MEQSVAPERLARTRLFSGLDAADLERVSTTARLLRAPVGHVFTEENDLSTTFFVLLAGSVTVHRAGRHVDDMSAGDAFGEVGTMNLTPRNATVIATTPVEAAVFMGWDLRALVDELPPLRTALEATAAQRRPGG